MQCLSFKIYFRVIFAPWYQNVPRYTAVYFILFFYLVRTIRMDGLAVRACKREIPGSRQNFEAKVVRTYPLAGHGQPRSQTSTGLQCLAHATDSKTINSRVSY